MWADIIAVGVQSKNRQLKKWSGSHPLCIATLPGLGSEAVMEIRRPFRELDTKMG